MRTALHGHEGPLSLQHAYLLGLVPIAADAPVAELFGHVAQAACAVPVVQASGQLAGVISKTTLLRFLDRDTPPIDPGHGSAAIEPTLGATALPMAAAPRMPSRAAAAAP